MKNRMGCIFKEMPYHIIHFYDWRLQVGLSTTWRLDLETTAV